MISVASLALPLDTWDRLLTIAAIVLLEVPFCIYLWHGDKAPRLSASGWLGAAVVSVLVGAVSFASDVWLGWHHHPDLPAVAAAMNSGPGLIVTFGACPVGTIACLASAVRVFAQRRYRRASTGASAEAGAEANTAASDAGSE